jgi:exopolysaccharide production protein ExoQ
MAMDQLKSTSFLEHLRSDRPGGDARVAIIDVRQQMLKLAAYAFLAMVLMSPMMTFNELGMTGEGSSTRQVGYLLILLAAIYGAGFPQGALRLVALPIPMIVALGWCYLSLTWAIDPDIGFRRLLLTTLAIWTVFIIVGFSGYRATIDTMRGVLVVALVVNYIVVFVDPPVGIHMMKDSSMPTAIIGNWRGFMVHKNFAGAATAICILMFLFDTKRVPSLVRVAILLASAYFLYRTQSKTSAGMAGLALLAGLVFQFASGKLRMYVIPVIVAVTTGAALFVSAYQNAIQTKLDPTSFTGRGHIWSVMINYASDNLYKGAGFGSFWNIGPTSPIYHYGTGYVTQISVGHNGYLDLLVTVGLPGLILIIFAAIIWPLMKLLTNTTIDPAKGGLLTALLLFCIGHNITESSLFERDAIVGMIMMFTIALIHYARPEKTKQPSRRSRGRSEGEDVLRTFRRRHLGANAVPN